MVENEQVSFRIKMKDKTFDKVKTSVEEIVVLHDGSFHDEFFSGGKVKTRYERLVDGTMLAFIYTWHQTTSDRRAAQNARSQFHTHLRKLKIMERLPRLSLSRQPGASYDESIIAWKTHNKKARSFVSLDDALLAWEEQMADDLLKFDMDKNAGDGE